MQTMNNIEIKKITLADVNELQDISRQTFYDTFSEVNTKENMKKYLDESFSIEKLTQELSNINSEFYFARQDSKPIGYLKLNFRQAQTELNDENSVELERIYVLKAFLGKRVGQLLYDKAVEIARAKKANYIWLGVWEKNLRAIHFYKKNGFWEFNKHVFKLGNDEQTDLMMKLDL